MTRLSNALHSIYTMFIIELQSRQVHVAGSTRYPDEAFVMQAIRGLANPVDGILVNGCVLVCDQDRKWSRAVLEFLEHEGIRIIRTPFWAPNCTAYAERFVRSIKEECLDRVIPLGEGHLRRTIAEYIVHYHRERNHQGLSNELIRPLARPDDQGPVRRRRRIGGMLSYYYRAA